MDRRKNSEFHFREQFNAFIDDFDIVGVHYGVSSNLSAAYFLRLLQEGSKARPHRSRRRPWISDTNSDDLVEYYYPLFDHGAFWKTRNGTIIYTGMPYRTQKPITEWFAEMANEYKFPETIKLRFMEDKYKYKYRPNGHYMIMVYSENGDSLPK